MTRHSIAIAALLAGTAATAQEPIAQADSTWYTDAQAMLQEKLAHQPNTGRAKNVILFVADGNGVTTNYATRIYAGQQAGSWATITSCPTRPSPTRRWSRPTPPTARRPTPPRPPRR